jgi:hypothetical protein
MTNANFFTAILIFLTIAPLQYDNLTLCRGCVNE